MSKLIRGLAVGAALVSIAAPAVAHHNANAQYDNSKEMTVTGALIEMKDIRPHAQWKVSVPGANGQAVVYNFEAQGGTALRRVGINVKTDLKPGQTYTYTFSPARNGSPSGFLSAIVIGGKRFQITML
jgi:hypothetical protein